jgi:hypothetical protein
MELTNEYVNVIQTQLNNQPYYHKVDLETSPKDMNV